MRDFKDFLNSKDEEINELFGFLKKPSSTEEEVHARKLLAKELEILRNKYQTAAQGQKDIRKQRIFNTVAFLLKKINL
jgi:hypothetical protein